jgi:LytS/YehU family sensor histidine kinase
MESYGVLTKFSKLIRRMFENHNHPCWLLKDEIKFLTDYLDLQKQRFKDAFDYKIYVEEDLGEQTMIPRLFLQTLAENALKHRILPGRERKNIITRIYKEQNRTIISIENDGQNVKSVEEQFTTSLAHGNGISNGNGKGKQYYQSIGKNVAHSEMESTGKGLSIAQQLFNIFNQYNKEKIHFNIEDLWDNAGNPAGMRVSVSIPDDYDYTVFDNPVNQFSNQSSFR